MLHPAVFRCVEEHRDNNNRDWFKDNKHKRDAARACVVQFTQALFVRLSDENQLDGQKVFRVYRDVRFSKNKTPYKSHFGIGFHRIKPQYRGGYYLHLEPGASFFGAGFWGPNKDDLFRVRKEIEMDPEYFEKMATGKKLTETWGAMKGDQLKTAPKGFDKEHPGINHLRFKQYIFTKEIPDTLLFDENFEQWMVDHFNAIRPFLDYMGEVLTSDLNGASLL